MDQSIDYVTKISGRFTALVNDGIDRWKYTLADARKGNYTSDRLARDMITAWADAADAWTFPLQFLLPPAPSVVVFNIDQATKEAVEVARIPQYAPGKLVSEDLRIPGSGKMIWAKRVSAEVSQSGHSVIVRLTKLDSVPGGLAVGTYTGVVGLLNGERVASVEVHVKAQQPAGPP